MAYLDENLSDRDERSAELRDEQAADEEISQSSSEELQIRPTGSLYIYVCVCVFRPNRPITAINTAEVWQ